MDSKFPMDIQGLGAKNPPNPREILGIALTDYKTPKEMTWTRTFKNFKGLGNLSIWAEICASPLGIWSIALSDCKRSVPKFVRAWSAKIREKSNDYTYEVPSAQY